MTELDALAKEVGVHGRTLRRAAARGLLRADRPGARTVVVAPTERSYVRAHWPLLSRVLEALRKHPNVRLAVLFGSVSRGTARPDSDLDVLVRLRRDSVRARAALAEDLEVASGRRPQIVSLEQAGDAPLLLADVLAEGRVLVDRDGDWPRLRRREGEVAEQARARHDALQADAWHAADALERIASRRAVGSR
jgi:predicted nucleotidyltransferase